MLFNRCFVLDLESVTTSKAIQQNPTRQTSFQTSTNKTVISYTDRDYILFVNLSISTTTEISTSIVAISVIVTGMIVGCIVISVIVCIIIKKKKLSGQTLKISEMKQSKLRVQSNYENIKVHVGKEAIGGGIVTRTADTSATTESQNVTNKDITLVQNQSYGTVHCNTDVDDYTYTYITN